MKITFLDAPNFLNKKIVERVFGCTYSLYPFPNIFSLSAAAVLEREGFSVHYLDMANERWNKKKVEQFFREDRSGAYVLYSVNLSMLSDIHIYRIIRDAGNEAMILFCGPAPTYFEEKFLNDEKCVVVRGEMEATVLDVVSAIRNGKSLDAIEGISFIKDGKMLHNRSRMLLEDIDLLPFPARNLLQKDLYYNPKLPKRPFTGVLTSRNCSYSCTFCVPNSHSFACELDYKSSHEGKKPFVRIRSADNVIKEFKSIAEQGYKSVSVIDDQFLWDEKRAEAICEGIKDLGIEWGCLARADRVTEAIAKKMKEAGCVYVDMGVESFSQDVLDDIKKGLKVEAVYNAIRILKANRLFTKINLMLGVSKLQDEELIKQDIAVAKKLDADAIMFSIATPFPGTEFYKTAKDNNYFVSGEYEPTSVQKTSVISYPHLSSQAMNRLITQANISFYFTPRFIVKNIKRIASPISLYYALLALKRKFF